jgi:hypothetical protein
MSDYFLIYSTVYLASSNKKFNRIQTKKLIGKKHRTHTQHTTEHTKTQQATASLPPAALPYNSMQHLPWPQIMVLPLPTSLLQAPGSGFPLATAVSLGWDAKLKCIKK